MTRSGLGVRSALALGVVAALAAGMGQAHAQAAGDSRTSLSQKTPKLQHWAAWGGTVGMRWNRDLAADVGLDLGQAIERQAELSNLEREVFALRQAGSLEFDVRNGNLYDFLGGSLQAQGGYVIATRGGPIDLSNFRLVPRGGNALILDLVSSDGQAWFYIDRLMYELIDDKQRLAVRTMDLRISPALARRLGHPEVANWAIADMELTTDVLRQGALAEPLGSSKWHDTAVPGVPGAKYQADLFMQSFSVQYSRCNGCVAGGGVGGNGQVVFTPSSTLKNNVNNGSLVATVPGDPLGTSSALYTADIPWYQKFSGNFAPYNNDQHPYLIWNLYRFNADGSLEQIGRSGVKHGFLTINVGCLENPGNSHILGRGCVDTYSVGNNDNNNSLGPRTEIVPATNQWGRCGSIYDTNCDGQENSSGNSSYDQRLVVREHQFSGAGQTGASYRFESWYLARQDINILNSMASTRATFTRNSTTWSVGGNDQYRLGPVIDRWVDPAAPGANASSAMVSTDDGNVKVAVRATSLGNGLWRYHYAVMNLDFSRPQTEGAEPNLRVVKNQGFDNFGVPVGTGTVTDLVFGDGDVDANNDWTPSIRNGRLTWWSGTRSNALNWGTLFRFSFTSNQAPVASAVTLHIASDSSREVLDVPATLAPASAGGAAARPAVAAR